MIVYVNGDSYAYISNGKRYSEFLAEHFNCESVNSSANGSSNSRIFRTSLRDLMQLVKSHDSVVAVISLTFPLRTELWDQSHKNHFVNDGDFKSFQTVTGPKDSRWFYDKLPVTGIYKEYREQWLRWYNIEAETVNLLKDIIFLTSWCRLNNVKCCIVSGPLQEPVDFSAPFINSFYNEVVKDTSVLNIFTNCFTEFCNSRGFTPIDDYYQEIHGKKYKIGHHGESAHKAFADFLLENYLK